MKPLRLPKASIAQRAGRAGRTSPGTVYRLWHEGQTASLPDFERPEILETDLSSLVLDLAQWGVSDPNQLRWIDPPPNIGWNEARAQLKSICALDGSNRITDLGKQIQSVPLSPRLALMVIRAAASSQTNTAAILALLLTERGLGGNVADLAERLERVEKDRSVRAEKLKSLAKSIADKITSNRMKKEYPSFSPGAILSVAFPDRIAKRIGSNQKGEVIYHLANGRKAVIDGLDKLTVHEFICVADLTGTASSSRLISGAAINESEIFELHTSEITKERTIKFELEAKQFKAQETTRLNRLILSSAPTKLLEKDQLSKGLIEAIEDYGLRLIKLRNEDDSEASRLRARLNFLHAQMPDEFKDVSDDVLLSNLEDWLLPFIEDCRTLSQINDEKICNALHHLVGFEKSEKVKQLVPTSVKVPTGSNVKLRYEEDKVILPVRVQELYGMSTHPHIMNGAFALTIELLSPAQRPIQTTKDIVGFWQGSWQDVKKEMKGRYPRHLWPDDPANTAPTTRVKKKS